jgi:rod shape determining protein RodA
MIEKKTAWFHHIDWVLFLVTLPIIGSGLLAMVSFIGESNFFERQLIWVAVSVIGFFILSQFDVRVLARTEILLTLYGITLFLLLVLFVLGRVSHGAQSWLSFGGFALQPSEIMKLVVILMLAKYFSRRHVEIAHPKHIIISGLYALIPFLLVFLQPDFGSAMIIFAIWFGMALVAGISKRHLLMLGVAGLIVFTLLWGFVFKPYQKARILTFIHPTSDLTGTGYNAYQSTVAIGSGQAIGKGVGFGTQSRLQFLPEYQTDFIFAAFAEEWGFIGVVLLFILFGVLIWRILGNAMSGASNFEVLFSSGVAIYFISHIIINVGMNLKLLPVTGITLPFMSYGGSHLVTEYAALGIVVAMRRYRRAIHRQDLEHEFIGA